MPDAEVLGAAEVVAEASPAVPPRSGSPFVAFSTCEGEGVEAAVSLAARGRSMPMEDLVGASWEAAPVFARLCLGWSASEGERDRLRVLSTSGMVGTQLSRGGGEEGLLATFTGVREVWSGVCVEGFWMGGRVDGKEGGCERDVDDGSRRHFCNLP